MKESSDTKIPENIQDEHKNQTEEKERKEGKQELTNKSGSTDSEIPALRKHIQGLLDQKYSTLLTQVCRH